MKTIQTTARLATVASLCMLLQGCFLWPGGGTPRCEKPQEYKTARSGDRLSVPEGMDVPDQSARLEIPAVGADAPIRQPGDPCLEEPPDYGGTGG